MEIPPSGWVSLTFYAGFLALSNIFVLVMMNQAARGSRNHFAGIRLPSLMASDSAWRAGHQAAKKPMKPLLIFSVVLALACIPLQLFPVLYFIFLGLSVACTLVATLLGAVVASRAARRVR